MLLGTISLKGIQANILEIGRIVCPSDSKLVFWAWTSGVLHLSPLLNETLGYFSLFIPITCLKYYSSNIKCKINCTNTSSQTMHLNLHVL